MDGSLVYRRSYNSQSNQGIGLGFNWASALYKRLEISGSPVQVRRGDGYGEPFTCPTSGTCTGDIDTGFALTKDTTGYTLTLRHNATERYGLNGRIVSETDASGRITSYAYDANGRLYTVTTPSGHTLTFGYDSSNRVSTITTPASEVIGYAYDAKNNLTCVAYPDSTVKLYHYERADLPHHLTGISYANDNCSSPTGTTRYATYDYDTTGKAIRTEHADVGNGGAQERFLLNYDSDTQTTVTDAIGTQEVMTFSTNLGVKNLVTKTSSIDTSSLQQTFDTNNNLTCKKDEENRVTLWSYNDTNQKTSMSEGLTGDCSNPVNVPGVTRTTTYEYLSSTLDLPRFIRRPSVAAGQTFETELVYGDAGHPNLPTQIIQRGFMPAGAAVSRTVSLGYSAYGQINVINGPRTDVSDVTTLEYNDCTTGGGCGQLKKVTNALGHITTYDLYDANGRLLQMTEPNGLRTGYTYDERGRVRFITQTPPTGSARVTEYRYTAFGEVVQAIYPDGVTLTYTYDAAQDLKTVTDNLGNRIEYTYDLKGNRIQDYTYDPNGTLVRQLDRSHDQRNRLASVNAAGSLTQTIFDAVGNLRSETDPNNNPATLHTPDALNRLIRTLDRLDGVTDYSYDINDRLVQVTAPGATDNRATTSYEYDDLGNRLKETSPDRSTTIYAHDAAGNVTGTTDARGIATGYTYDALNRLTLINYPGTEEDVGFTYDSGVGCSFGIGRLCRAVDESGTRSFAYDAYGNQQGETWLEITQGGSHATAYTHDPGDRWLSLTRPGGQDTAWGRDGLGRIESLVTGSTILQSHRGYRADGLMTGGVYGNGLRDVYAYDLQGRLVQSASAPDVSFPADGDLNGDGVIDVGDLVILIRIVHEIVAPTAEQAVRGDVHPPGAPDGMLDLRDYLRLQRMVLGWVP